MALFFDFLMKSFSKQTLLQVWKEGVDAIIKVVRTKLTAGGLEFQAKPKENNVNRSKVDA